MREKEKIFFFHVDGLKYKIVVWDPFLTLYVCLLSGMSKTKIKLGTPMHRVLSDWVGVQERGARITKARWPRVASETLWQAQQNLLHQWKLPRVTSISREILDLPRGDSKDGRGYDGWLYYCLRENMPDTWTWRRVVGYSGNQSSLWSIPFLPCLNVSLFI